MWMIEKSAGDKVSFVAVFVDGPMGHSYEYAHSLANEVTLAMIAAQPSAQSVGEICDCAMPLRSEWLGYCGRCGLPITPIIR